MCVVVAWVWGRSVPSQRSSKFAPDLQNSKRVVEKQGPKRATDNFISFPPLGLKSQIGAILRISRTGCILRYAVFVSEEQLGKSPQCGIFAFSISQA
jgi:hypothetical protein